MQHSAAQIPADLPGSGWYEILPPPGPPKVLDSSLKADWVIVGAGFAGLTAAKRITDNAPNDKVVVIDAQRIAWGASGRNSGFMIDLPHNVQSADYIGKSAGDLMDIRMNRFAIKYARSMIDEYGLHRFSSDIGKISAAADQAGVKALGTYAQNLEKIGESFSRYDKARLKSVTGTDFYSTGIHTPGCLLIQPAGYIRGIAESLPVNVTIYENSPVESIQSGVAHKVFTATGSVETSRLVLTVNGHLQSFGFYRRRLMHIFLYASMTRRLSESEQSRLGGDPEWGITPANPMGSTVRRTAEGRIVVRNSITYNPGMETSPRQIASAANRHNASFKARFPMLEDVDMQYRWSGQLCLSLNSVPVFGEVEKGLFVACCQNGLGAARGTLAGALIVDLAMDSDNALVREMLDYDEPEALYPEPFMTLGAKARLWWGQCRAGKDL